MPRAPIPGGRKLFFLFAFAAVLVGGVWWEQRPPPEPVYEGQRLSEWVSTDRDLAPEGLQAFGPTAVPWLAYAIEHRHRFEQQGSLPFDDAPEWLRGVLPERWGGLRKTPADYDDRGEDVRRNIAFALRGLGAEAAPAIPALLRTLESECKDGPTLFSSDAVFAIYAAGPASWPMVKERLQHGTPQARACLLNDIYPKLGSVGKPAPETEVTEVFTLIMEACSDPDGVVRAGAMRGFVSCRRARSDFTGYDAVIPQIILLLSDPDPNTRAAAAEAVGGFGAKGAPAIPRLIELLDDEWSGARSAAAGALGNLDKEDKRSAFRLRAMLYDSEKNCREAARYALKALGLPAGEKSVGEEISAAR